MLDDDRSRTRDKGTKKMMSLRPKGLQLGSQQPSSESKNEKYIIEDLNMDRKPLAKRGLPLPIGAIDHMKAKEKLAKIIESTDPKSFGSSSTVASTATLKGAASLIGSRSNHPFTSKNSRDLMSSQRQVGNTSDEDAHT